ncbi:MAG: thioredoxin [Candidatus Eisenbacteria bacterium]
MGELLHVNDANYDEIVEKVGKPAILDFGATWCSPCKALEPTMKQLAVQYGEQLAVTKVDIEEAPATAQRFGILSVPTVVLLKAGKEVHRFSGLQSKEKIADLIEKHLLG